MSHFSDFDLSASLLAVLEEADLVTPTALQAGTVPVMRRGGNVVARAGSGSGKTLAYTLGICERLAADEGEEESAGVRAVVLVPTAEAAERTAVAMAPFTEAVDAAVGTLGGGWRDAGSPDVLVTTPREVAQRVRTSALSLGALTVLVVDDADAIREMGEWAALETVMEFLPAETQRLVFTARLRDEVEDLAERRVRRALRFPPRAVGGERPEAGSAGTLHYLVVRQADKIATAARLLDRRSGDAGPAEFFRRGPEASARLVEELSRRGYQVAGAPAPDVDVVVRDMEREEEVSVAAISVSVDVPADAESLRARHGADGEHVVLVEPRERTHLEEIAGDAGFALASAPTPGSAPASDVAAFRERIARTLREEDLGAQMLLLEPLLEEHAAADVAGALSVLLRRRAPAAEAPASTAATPAARQPSQTAGERGAPPAFTHLYLSVGTRDGARPGDIVGAIAGEAGIPGSHVGKIDLRENFTIVEIHADDAERVIEALNGTTVKGRSLRVDFHRGGGDRPRRPVRRQVRRPPQRDA
jgi:ATP-dependent RNA helicase DeaD